MIEHEVRAHGRLYGHVWPAGPDRWDAEKTGEFDTVRTGFETREAATAWILTNPYPIHTRRPS